MTLNIPREELLEILSDLRGQIQRQEMLLDMTEDEDLIDAAIYELKALNCRYNHYLKLARAV